MEKNIRLSKSQKRMQKSKRLTSSQKSKDRIETQFIFRGKSDGSLSEQVNSETQDNKFLQNQTELMKTQIANYEQTFYKRRKNPRANDCIVDQNIEILILQSQLIKNSLVTENQLYEMSQTNFKQSQRSIIEKDLHYNSIKKSKVQKKLIQTITKELRCQKERLSKEKTKKQYQNLKLLVLLIQQHLLRHCKE